MRNKKIGIFDSGYGGLTVMKDIVSLLPNYTYVYLGDNARTPYGTRSQEVIYQYSLDCVKYLFQEGCELIILACNTASAQALHRLQQEYLVSLGDERKRILGVIRPTAEFISERTPSFSEIAFFATEATVQSQAYEKEIQKTCPSLKVQHLACPLFVPLVEAGEHMSVGAEYFIQKYTKNLLSLAPHLDALILACTHYPLLQEGIEKYLPSDIQVLNQGPIVAKSLEHYLKTHPKIESCLLKESSQIFYTTDSAENFDKKGSTFYGQEIHSKKVSI